MARVAMALVAGAGAMALAAVGVLAAERPAWTDSSGLLREVAHKHVHLSGHDLLGENLKHDGKHELGKLKGHTVTADVKGGKVTGMAAGDLPVTHVKSNKKMALGGGLIRIGYDPSLRLAQYVETYYAYCFDDGVSYTCYWYPESDVAYADTSWTPYDPTY